MICNLIGKKIFTFINNVTYIPPLGTCQKLAGGEEVEIFS